MAVPLSSSRNKESGEFDMKGIIVRSLGLTVVLAAFTVTLTAGETPKAKDAGTPLITDWTHRHVVFSQPRTPEQAVAVQKDVRYQQQLARHTVHPLLSTKVDKAAWRRFQRWQRLTKKKTGLHRDWAVSLGNGASAGEGRFPAKYSFSSTIANCTASGTPDFIVFPTGVPGAGGQASVMALQNLYVGCSGQVPASYWAYNTGGTVNTSPVLSYDGTQIAFTQTTGGAASLVLLRWSSAAFTDVQSPGTPTLVANGAYPGCTAPCMTTFALNADDTNSSVFYDYGGDAAYVGDDNGVLHQFTGVFKGTPAEVTTGGWPASVSGGAALTSAVYDSGSTNAFVGDSGGFLYRVDSTGGVTQSGQLDVTLGLNGGPVVDRGISAVYAFVSDDGLGTAGVYQLSTNFIGGDFGGESTLGVATTGTTPVYNGAFDHDYIFSANSTGSLYVCGNPGGKPTLYKVPISGGTMQASVAGPILSNTTLTKCSPVTDVYNPTVTGQGLPEEWAFASVQAAGAPSPCSNVSCLMNFRTSSWEPNTVYNAGQLILDSNMNIQVADNSGFTSGSTPPNWSNRPFGQTLDGGVHWRFQQKLSGTTPATWTANFTYAGNFEILDPNGNIQINRTALKKSGATQPTWATQEGQATTDGQLTWINLGANPVAAIQEPGGTSGIVMDNTAILGSQVYFSTLSGGCAPAGNGGCAVQASQQGLN
jgi:hypothetical protein